ncbi:MAG TPA: putative 2OG-Fe(II) oxygenase [Allosphingosinicella sp.]
MPFDRDKLRLHIQAVKPQDADEAYRAGLKALDHRLEAEALKLIEAARRVHPLDHRLWQVSGLLHRSLEDLEPALAQFERAAALAPGDPLIAHSLAQVHLEAGLPSLELFKAAKRLGPQSRGVAIGYAVSLGADVGPEAAIDELDRELASNPRWLEGHEMICRLRWQAGEKDSFGASFVRALKASPRDLPLWQALINMLMQGELYDLALRAVVAGRAAAGPHPSFDISEAGCRAELGEWQKADELFGRLAQVDDVMLKVRQIRHFLRRGRPAEAAELGISMSNSPAAHLFWPYISIAWRLTGDPRWQWLEGDPRLVGVYQLSEGISSWPELANRLRALHTTRNQPFDQSVVGGTQTVGALFARIDPEIQALRRAVADAVREHVKQLPPADPKHPILSVPRDAPVRFSGSWSVRLLGSGRHSNHVHPLGWMSSALYVSLPEQDERGPDPAGWLSLGQPQEQLGITLPPTRLVEPKQGHLVLFPSTMWHGTIPFGGGERLTVAFDVAR